MIELINIKKSYNTLVINNLNYTFKDNGFYLLDGESGSGKTTLFNIIDGRCKYEGIVNVDQDIFFLSFNNYLLDNFTVKENIEFNRDLFKNFKEYKDVFCIEPLLNKKVNKLSLGERQKVGLFIALSSNCKIILLDEIFAGVDILTRKLFLRELKKVSRKRLIIVSSHQQIESYDYLIHLKEGKIVEKVKENRVINKVTNRKLERIFKWGMILHKKQIISRLLFVTSLFGSLNFFNDLSGKFTALKNDFTNSFQNKEVYYKSGNKEINKDVFYDEIVSKLPYEVKDYFYRYYNDGMYEVRVEANENYIGNGDIFTKINYLEGLKENELVLMINDTKYCTDNGYVYCPKNQIRDSLIGSYLQYKYKDNEIKYLIKDVIYGNSSGVYLTFMDECLEKIEQIHSQNIGFKYYYLVIYNEKLNNFYNKINSIDSLLNYKFTFVNNDEDNSYFLVSESELKFFSESEIKDEDIIVCSDIGYSCSSLDFSKFISLYYIDDIEVKNKIVYKSYNEYLEYNQIIVSSSLANYLNKKVGDRIQLKFYFDNSFYVLDNVEIVNIIENQDDVIYHNKYDYLLFKEIFNKELRVSYIYSENELKYLKRDSFNYEFISETKSMLEKIVVTLNITSKLFMVFMIGVLFIIENNKFRKHYRVFNFIKLNRANWKGVYNLYMSFYLIIGLISIENIFYCFMYYCAFVVFYLINKSKIKSRKILD